MQRMFLLLLVLLAACGPRTSANAADAAAAAQFKPPPVQPPAPLPGQGHSNPITAYVGKYPGDAVNGVAFFDRTEVANVLIDAVPDPNLRRLIAGREATSVPIFTVGGRLAAHACEPHDCGDHNWTFLVKPDGSGGMACYHTAAMGATSHWYAGGAPVTRPGGCPQA